ncbi:unnamed protein product [Rotaria magnacalcarata]|uniref:Insulin-like growth factor binding protein-related protein 1 n=1 Tax=Rotaria magnacalcarata TaxID=392030 RepID=A0A816Z9E2_9BILA|nr:unnamed protein product [Rotaria magnacalcarata]CAF1674851.1 unnamed protein product [Rotaria magnacalcarata]CAF1917333.1 unnamed protein product [Rotaria magnacalcarata]CAF1917339.1 unnamed protein product [Rotaria magnacalcarata]CAF2128375.1 unnamed protein product [Rotaria magnacalcarata]
MATLRILTLFILAIVYSIVSGQTRSCEPCDSSKCPLTSDKECLAGLTLDRCGCCQVCAQRESEQCNHPDVPSSKQYEACGESLQCKVHVDARVGRREARCECNDQVEVCGTDGKTYRNYCHLMESSKLAKIEQKPIIKVARRKPCDTAPEITVPPVSVTNKTGSNVFLTCEVAGVPLPVVEWVYRSQTGKQIVYPTDDDRISTLVRGGPNAHVITSWLQIQSLEFTDQGSYTCVASNSLGKVERSCNVRVERGKEF